MMMAMAYGGDKPEDVLNGAKWAGLLEDAQLLVKEMSRLAEDGSRRGPDKRQNLHNRSLADYACMILGGKMGGGGNIPKSTMVEGKHGHKDYLRMKSAHILKASECFKLLGKTLDPNSSEYDYSKTFVQQICMLLRTYDAKKEAYAAVERERRLSGGAA